MKKFEDIKIVACVMIHDDEYSKLVLEDLSKYVDEIYVNLNNPSEPIKEIVKNCPKIVKIINTTNKRNWNQGLQRDNTIRMLDDIKPDIVLFPDSDETYPKNLKEQLKDFWEKEKKKTFWFRLLYLWEDDKHYRNDGIWKAIHHVRAFKWQPDIKYIPYAGYACPTTYINLPRETRYNSDTPTLHYGYMTEKNRGWKYQRVGPGYDALRHRRYEEDSKKNLIVKEVKEKHL